MFKVYLITNTENQMKYVGVTCRDVEVRFKEHVSNALVSNSMAPLHQAIRKFGADKFVVEVLESEVVQEDARDRELFYISKYHTSEPDGYNNYRSGMGGLLHSEESKQHISEGLVGHVWSESRNEKVRQAMIHRDYKQSWSDNLSASRKGRFTKENNPFFGRSHTPEVKARILQSRFSHPDHHVECVSSDGKVIASFNCFADAGRWVVAQGLAKTDAVTCAERISRNVRSDSNRFFYGGVWRFQGRSID